MTPGQLVKAVSIALDVPEETVVQHDRNLAMSGLRTKGGRGRSAPEVTPLDAARLFIAILGAVRTKDSVDTINKFETAMFRGRHAWLGGVEVATGSAAQETDIAVASLPLNHNLIDALAVLIEEASRPIEDLQSFLDRFSKFTVTCAWPSGQAKIGRIMFSKYSPAEVASHQPREKANERWFVGPKESDERSYFASGVTQERSAHGSAIMLLGAAFRENGSHYTNAHEAYLAGYGAGTKIAESAQRSGRR
jgi:hypothetical protein